jgi:hypothetical protein
MERHHRTRFVMSVVLLCMTAMLVGSVSQAAAAVMPDARLATIIADIDSTAPGSAGDQLLTIEEDLTGVQPCVIDGLLFDFGATQYCRWARGPQFGENGINMANEYVRDYLIDAGVDSVVNCPWWGVDVTYGVPSGRGTDVSGDEWIGELTGTTKPDEIVIVCGHLDSVSYNHPHLYPMDFLFAPGADDNLSGAATTMIAAKMLCQYSFVRTIRFACWNGEEVGLFGAEAYAKRCRENGENIVAVVNVEMTGYDEDGSALVELHTRNIGNGDPANSQGNGYADKRIADKFVDVVNAYGIALNPVILDDNQPYSDHWSFWTRGYNAIAVEEQDLKDNPTYHRTTDTVANLTWPYYTRIAGATVATVAHLAQIEK